MNLHELPTVNRQTWDGQPVREGDADGKDALLPVFQELADDMLDIVLIDQKIILHDLFWREPFFGRYKDLLLFFQEDLGVWDERGRDDGMGIPAALAFHPLDGECDKLGKHPYLPGIMPVPDQASSLAASAFHLMQLNGIKHAVIGNLGKSIAIFSLKRYHNLVFCTEEIILP